MVPAKVAKVFRDFRGGANLIFGEDVGNIQNSEAVSKNDGNSLHSPKKLLHSTKKDSASRSHWADGRTQWKPILIYFHDRSKKS